MTENIYSSRPVVSLFILAAFVVIVAGLRAAEPIVVPFLLALFVSIIASAPLRWMQKKGIPTVFAVLITILAVAAGVLLVGAVIGQSINEFTDRLPYYQIRLQEQSVVIESWFDARGITIGETPIAEYFNVAAVMRMVGTTLSGLGNLLANGFLIILTILFLLLEASEFPDKLRLAFNRPISSFDGLRRFTQNVRRYIAIKTVISLATGISAGAFLAILGVDFALLWGLLAFLLNFIPNIGSLLAAIPPILLAVLQLGIGDALLVAIAYATINLVFGSLLEPRWLGRGLGMSTLVVFTSLVFWGWVLGPVGMLLAVPLTMTVMIALQSNKDTIWLAILLGSKPKPVEEVLDEDSQE